MFPPMNAAPKASPDIATPTDPIAILDTLQKGIDDLRAALAPEVAEEPAEFMPQSNDEVMAGIPPTPKKKGAF